MGTTVVIPQRNRGGARLWNCLNALKRQSVAIEEIIVSDLSSDEGQLDNIRGTTLGVGATFLRIEWLDTRFSRAVAINCGIRCARSVNVVVIDVDVVVAPHFVETYEARLRDDLMLMCEHRRGREVKEGEDVSSDWGAYFASAAPNPWPHCANGMSMGARRAFWARIFGVDERFVGWGAEDDHAVWKAEMAGGNTGWIDDALIIHQDHEPVPDLEHFRGVNHGMFDRLRQEGLQRRQWGSRKLLELRRGA